jgi:type I restriction enzyme S subunit
MSWRTLSVGDLVDAGAADIQTGPFGTQLKASDYVDDGTPVINVRNIGFGGLKPEKLEFVTEETAERLSSHLLKPRDIVFGRKGAVDRHLYVGVDQEHWMQGSDCIRLRFLSTDVVPRFVSYGFLTGTHQKWMLAQAGNKATMPSLNHEIIRRITLRLPMAFVQEATVDILSAYDDLIENNRRRMALLEEAARQLYREWFVRLRFPGHEHTPIANGVPAGWARRRVEELAGLRGGKQLEGDIITEDGAVPVFGGNGVQGYTAEKTHEGFVIAFGRVGANCGSVHWSYEGAWINNNASGLVPHEHPELFLHHLLHFDFTNLRKGAAQPFIPNGILAGVEFWRPSRTLANLFCENVRPLRQQQGTLARSNQKLRAARDLLLPRLMSGAIAV